MQPCVTAVTLAAGCSCHAVLPCLSIESARFVCLCLFCVDRAQVAAATTAARKCVTQMAGRAWTLSRWHSSQPVQTQATHSMPASQFRFQSAPAAWPYARTLPHLPAPIFHQGSKERPVRCLSGMHEPCQTSSSHVILADTSHALTRRAANCSIGSNAAVQACSTQHASWWQHVGGMLSVAAAAAVLILTPMPASALDAQGPTAVSRMLVQQPIDSRHKASQSYQPITQSSMQDNSYIAAEQAGSSSSSSSSSLQGTTNQQAVVPGLASEVEDKLLEVVRQLEARVDNALGVVTSGPRLPFGMTNSEVSQEERDQLSRVAQTLISEVWDVVDQNYLDARSTGWDRKAWQSLRDEALYKEYTDTAAVYRAIRDMMARGLSDPYCRFITPSELAAMKKYDVTGIGLNLGTSAEYVLKTGRSLAPSRVANDTGVFVVGISKGSPADKAGVRQGDELLAVDGINLARISPFQAASLIAGQQADGDGNVSKQKPYVQLEVRKVDGGQVTVQVDRPVRTLNSPVKADLVKIGDEQVGMLRLTSFNARAQRDLATAIKSLTDSGAQSLVLDLRDNRGGLVSEGLEVARLFLQGDAPIVFTESRSMSQEVPRASGPALTQLPLTVVVNEHTASASEIVAGALHDNCRAVLVGGRTYGKGLIQSVYELSDGSGMVLTVGKYLTPNMTDIDRSGIQPDFVTRPTPRLAADTLKACRLSSSRMVASVRG